MSKAKKRNNKALKFLTSKKQRRDHGYECLRDLKGTLADYSEHLRNGGGLRTENRNLQRTWVLMEEIIHAAKHIKFCYRLHIRNQD